MRYIVVDTETTGFPDEGGALVEIAAISRTKLNCLKEFQTYVDPGHPIPPVARAVHHISDDDVRGAPSPVQAQEELSIAMGAESGEVVWVAHNMAFDERFLEIALADQPKICTYRCALHLFPDAPGHSNQVLRYHLNLDESGELQLPEGLHPHRALYDILVTEGILRRMMAALRGTTIAEARTDDEILAELIRLSTLPAVLTKARFGKHAGKAWEWIVRSDGGWCDWYLRLPDGDGDVRHTIMHHRRNPPQGRMI